MPTSDTTETTGADQGQGDELDTDSPRRTLKIFAVAATVAFVLFVGWRLFGSEVAWLVIVAMAYTPYVVAMGIVVLALAIIARNPVASLASFVALCTGIVLVAPRGIAHDPVYDGVPLTLMTINLGVGGANVDQIADLVDRYDVDVLSVQELTPQAAESLDEASALRRLRYRHIVPIPANAAGSGLYSMFPLSGLDQWPGVFANPMATLTVDGATPVSLVSMHVASPHRPAQFDAWTTETRGLPSPGDIPWIVAGDFNATVDHAEFRAVVDRGFVDAASAAGSALSGTWSPAWFVPAVALDHVLVQDGIGVAWAVVEGVEGTDHAAVISELALPFAPR